MTPSSNADKIALAGRRRAIFAGIAGNVMEWYDFAVYGYFATVIGQQFFPAKDKSSSLIAAFGVFAAGFLMRPLGSLVFGHIGDKLGRKLALTASVMVMAVPTFLIGLLPTYEQAGRIAPLLLVLLRLVQGLSVGGEYTTSGVFLVEQSAPERRGFLGSFVPLGATFGVLLGSAVSALLTTVLDRGAIAVGVGASPSCSALLSVSSAQRSAGNSTTTGRRRAECLRRRRRYARRSAPNGARSCGSSD
jgi:MHS family proline/betaine transporter-like MFS transporter